MPSPSDDPIVKKWRDIFKNLPAKDKGCPDAEPTEQVYIEVFEGKLRVHVWDGSESDPKTIEIKPKD